MNILIINDCGLSGGGTEIRISLLIKELLKRKKVSSIHLLEHESSATVFDGITIHRCSTEKSGRVTSGIIKRFNIDIVQIHNLSMISTRPIIASKKLDTPVIFFLHDYWPFCGKRDMFSKWGVVCDKTLFFNCVRCIGLKSFLNTVRNKKHLNLCDIGIAPSDFCIRMYEKHHILNKKWVKVMPWIDSLFTSSVKNVKREKNVILFVGPLTKPKGAYLIAKALKYVREKIPDIKLRYIGCNQEQNSIERKKIEKILIKECTINNVEFLGEKSPEQLKEEYLKASVYVCCPLWNEVFGQTWAQALACGTKVVATNVGSISELFSAQAVKPNYRDLANAVVNVIKTKQDEIAAHWISAEDIVCEIENIYFKLAKRDKNGAFSTAE